MIDAAACQGQLVTQSHPWSKTVNGVLLRDPRDTDIDVIASFRNLPEVNRWLIVTHQTPDELRRAWLGVPSSETDFSCIAEVDGELAGVGFLEIEDGMGQPGKPRGTDAGIGYIVRSGYEGRGVASAIALGLVEAAFVDLGLRRVTAG